MRLARLTADFLVTQTRLAFAVQHGVAIATQVALTRRAADLMTRIEGFEPQNEHDRRAKIAFFLDRAKRSKCKRQMDIALGLLDRFGDGATAPHRDKSTLPHEVLIRLTRRGASRGELANYVAGLDQRASLVDTQFRHITTSKANRAFHNRPHAFFEGIHMADLVGQERYSNRTLTQMSKCMSGQAVTYYYSLDVPVLGSRVMQCHMQPWLQTTGDRSGMSIWVDDVTDRLTIKHGFGDLPLAWPDRKSGHSMDGTT